jgi:hypothetical protein
VKLQFQRNGKVAIQFAFHACTKLRGLFVDVTFKPTNHLRL